MSSHQVQNQPVGSLLAELPEPASDAREHSARLVDLICDEMSQSNGQMPFDRFMERALYAPSLGYYTAGARKFGEAGDFVTAPELSPLFARCLARQCQQVLNELGGGDLLEVGAGTGAMAADLLLALETLEMLPEHYFILLQARVPHLFNRVEWLDLLPESGFRGMVIANEVLDAMPVSRFKIEKTGVREGFVCWENDQFQAVWGNPVTQGLTDAISSLQERVGSLAVGYESEINLRADYWLQALSRSVEAGVVLLVDYGYPCSEYYHPQRFMGTLLCHYRHRAHDNPLILSGLQDITAHVNFTAVAKAGLDAGFKLGGYTTQAHFLLGCGLESLLMESDPHDIKRHMTLMQEVKRLTMPTEMGELFKAIALVREVEASLIGFSVRDLSGRL